MNTELQHILFVEDDRGHTMLYADILEDAGFASGKSFDYEIEDNTVAHFAYTVEEARNLIRVRPYTAVFLDHELHKDPVKTSEHLAPEILRRNAACTLYLTSATPMVQIEAVTRTLSEAGLVHHVSKLQTYRKGDVGGLTQILNGIIRPPSLASHGTPYPNAKLKI